MRFGRLLGVGEELRSLSEACGPLGLDFNAAGFSGRVVVEAAPSVVFGAAY